MNSFRYCLLSIGFLYTFGMSHVYGQQIKGHVYDSQNRQPLAGVTLLSATDQAITQTDVNGYFEISAQAPIDAVKAVMIGYKTQWIKIKEDQQELNVQLDVDHVQLSEVRVAGYGNARANRETAGAISVVTTRDINRGSAVSLQSAFNSIPGVRMDQSTLSEARISIRGNGVRSSYGIRNIKIYVNDIPITEADGTTRIEAIDVNSIGRAEIIKGPASSIYGAGTGGVINLKLQRSPYQEQSLEATGLIGAYGLHRLATTYRNGGDRLNSYVSYGWQEYAGYREHSKDMRRFITGNFQLFPSDKRIITLLVNRTTQHAQIPGSLTAEQIADNPKQANTSNLDKAAGRYQNWTRIGLGQQYRFNDRFSNNTSVFTYFYDLDHPLPYAYLHNFYQSYGGRTQFAYQTHWAVLPTRFMVGAEYNEGRTKGTQYVNNHGTEGDLNANIDYRNTQYSLFYQSETVLAPQTTLTLGLSYNQLSYDVTNYLLPEQNGTKKFDPQATPRIALSHHFNEVISLHASVSTGFSPPSSSEIKNVDGSINPLLQAERGTNYELNAKGNLLGSRLAYDLALFKMDMKDELIAQAVEQGITIYHNAGKTKHNGVELALSYQLLNAHDGKQITSLRPYAAITYSDFTFGDYKTRDAEDQIVDTYDGNQLTGIAPWVVSAGIDLETNIGVYLNGSYLFNDRMPVNDANTVFNASYHVVNAKIGYQEQVARHIALHVYAGLDNILNKHYSSILSLNAVGYGGAQPAYFNPSPARNGYGGLNIKYIF